MTGIRSCGPTKLSKNPDFADQGTHQRARQCQDARRCVGRDLGGFHAAIVPVIRLLVAWFGARFCLIASTRCWPASRCVHHAIQVPLGIDLFAPAQVQPRQMLVVPDVAKHRFHRTDALPGTICSDSSTGSSRLWRSWDL